MRNFIDTEFIEAFRPSCVNWPFNWKSSHFIDFISIGIHAEDGSELYLVSYEFDIKRTLADKWIRDNVITPLWHELHLKNYYTDQNDIKKGYYDILDPLPYNERLELYVTKMLPYGWDNQLTEVSLKRLLLKHGHSNEQIADKVKEFISKQNDKPEFIGYYCDYDWVLFCSLFGRMIDLPEGFPMYCKDLKQMLDERIEESHLMWWNRNGYQGMADDLQSGLEAIKQHPMYPKQENEHNALADARWNKKLYDFIQHIGR